MRCGPPARGLGEGLTVPYCKKQSTSLPNVTQDFGHVGSSEHSNEPLGSINVRNFLTE
jgi:hypothetical protein